MIMMMMMMIVLKVTLNPVGEDRCKEIIIELLKETGYGLHSLCQNIPKYCIVIDYIQSNVRLTNDQ